MILVIFYKFIQKKHVLILFSKQRQNIDKINLEKHSATFLPLA